MIANACNNWPSAFSNKSAPSAFAPSSTARRYWKEGYRRTGRLGWIGKNTLVLNRRPAAISSWRNLSTCHYRWTTAQQRTLRALHHGYPTACVGPYVLDARRCIFYLTIELKNPHRSARTNRQPGVRLR
jgi:hypothetical protein